MRVASGKFRGLKLNSLEGIKTRPTLEKTKLAIFNMIQKDIRGSKCLDLFSGSGNLGIEAYSNGAQKVIFIDNNVEAINIINGNISKINDDTSNLEVYFTDAFTYLNNAKDNFDIIFLDPPYDLQLLSKLLELIIDNEILCENGLVILEGDIKEEIIIKKPFLLYKDKQYGRTKIRIIRSLK